MAFRFKKFSIEDDRSSMKVGTDAVILGAWSKIESSGRILDVGNGSGVIALMLAQRSEDSTIDAVEVDNESVLQARQNVQSSPWKGRINIVHDSVQNFCITTERRYDVVVSNPPYFENSLKPGNAKKHLSKHSDSLPHDEMFYCVKRLMKPGGSFTVILPYTESANFIGLGLVEGIFVNKQLEIYTKPGQTPERLIFEFRREKSRKIQKSKLFLRKMDGSYTEEYKALTRDFYLNF